MRDHRFCHDAHRDSGESVPWRTIPIFAGLLQSGHSAAARILPRKRWNESGHAEIWADWLILITTCFATKNYAKWPAIRGSIVGRFWLIHLPNAPAPQFSLLFTMFCFPNCGSDAPAE